MWTRDEREALTRNEALTARLAIERAHCTGNDTWCPLRDHAGAKQVRSASRQTHAGTAINDRFSRPRADVGSAVIACIGESNPDNRRHGTHYPARFAPGLW